MRAALAGLLLQDPDLLLLDEPTNHLDVPTLTWFDDFLRRSNKALMLISPRPRLPQPADRPRALAGGRGAAQRTWATTTRTSASAPRRWSSSRRRPSACEARKRAELQAFIDRFGAKATKARQAQSRAKMLEKMEDVQVLEERATVRFRFPEVERSGRDVATAARAIHKRYGEHVVYSGLDARRGARPAHRGDRAPTARARRRC